MVGRVVQHPYAYKHARRYSSTWEGVAVRSLCTRRRDRLLGVKKHGRNEEAFFSNSRFTATLGDFFA